MEQAREAKALLDRLLGFQNLHETEGCGNFPIYLHEYPVCGNDTTGLQLLTPFYWILHHFGTVLGALLKAKLEQSARLALSHSLEAHRQKNFPYFFAVRLAAAQFAYGSLWNQEEWREEGREQLQELSKSQLDGWTSSKQLGELLLGLQMVYPSLSNSQWLPLWRRMEQTWHVQTASYIGPFIREWQEGEEPQPHLYDLLAGYFSGHFSRRATLLRPYHLYGALIPSTTDRFQLSPYPSSVQGQFKEQSWRIVRYQGGAAATLMQKKEPSHPSVEKTFTPFRFIWGDLHRVHSFVCQGGSFDQVEYIEKGPCTELIFDLHDIPPEEPVKQKREIEFFVDFHPGVQFTINNRSSSTFELGQEMKITMGNYELILVFDLLDGEGDFLGHVMRGNRPSQMDIKGDMRFQSYDWTFFVRTIRRRNRCRLRASLTFSSEKPSHTNVVDGCNKFY